MCTARTRVPLTLAFFLVIVYPSIRKRVKQRRPRIYSPHSLTSAETHRYKIARTQEMAKKRRTAKASNVSIKDIQNMPWTVLRAEHERVRTRTRASKTVAIALLFSLFSSTACVCACSFRFLNRAASRGLKTDRIRNLSNRDIFVQILNRASLWLFQRARKKQRERERERASVLK